MRRERSVQKRGNVEGFQTQITAKARPGSQAHIQITSKTDIRSTYSGAPQSRTLPGPKSRAEVCSGTAPNYDQRFLAQPTYSRRRPEKQTGIPSYGAPSRQLPKSGSKEMNVVLSETSISSIRMAPPSGIPSRGSRIPAPGSRRYSAPSGIRPPSSNFVPCPTETKPSTLREPSIGAPSTSRLRPPSRLLAPTSGRYSSRRDTARVCPGDASEASYAERAPSYPENVYDTYDPQTAMTEGDATDACYENYPGEDETQDTVRVPQESIMQWFDRAVETEMQHRQGPSQTTNVLRKLEASLQGKHEAPPLRMHQAVSAASGVDIEGKLRITAETELTDAVDKLLKAQAIEQFQGAVYAAELAAEMASPEQAEEAAAAAAKDMSSMIQYQAEVTGAVSQKIPGEKPIEVVGYIGITRPKVPMRPYHWNT